MNAIVEYEMYKAFNTKSTMIVLLNAQLSFQSNSLYATGISIQDKVGAARLATFVSVDGFGRTYFVSLFVH